MDVTGIGRRQLGLIGKNCCRKTSSRVSQTCRKKPTRDPIVLCRLRLTTTPTEPGNREAMNGEGDARRSVGEETEGCGAHTSRPIVGVLLIGGGDARRWLAEGGGRFRGRLGFSFVCVSHQAKRRKETGIQLPYNITTLP